MQARIVWAPALAVISARLPLADSTLWIAARDAEAARKEIFLPEMDNNGVEMPQREEITANKAPESEWAYMR